MVEEDIADDGGVGGGGGAVGEVDGDGVARRRLFG